MRRAHIYYKEVIAGILTETDDGDYVFQYDEKYIAEHPKESISLTMPVSSKPYTDKRLFPFFEGLIPEGWLLDIASKNWKIDCFACYYVILYWEICSWKSKPNLIPIIE
mgnify:CR=1 FL=1